MSFCYTFSYCVENLVNGVVGRQSAVEDIEVTLQSLWDVVSSSSWMDHGTHHLNVHDVDVVTRLLKVVEALHLNHLTSDFIGHLKQRGLSKVEAAICSYFLKSIMMNVKTCN